MATKQITINENCKINMDSSIGWLLIYRENFGRDILPDILPMISAAVELIFGGINEEGEVTLATLKENIDSDTVTNAMIQLSGLEITTVINIVWALAKNYAKKNNEILEPVEMWVDRFDEFPLDEIIPAAFKLIAQSSMSSKNLRSLTMRAKEESPKSKPKKSSLEALPGGLTSQA